MNTLLVSPTREHPVLGDLEKLIRARRGFGAPEVVALDRVENWCRGHQPEFVIVILDGEQVERTLEAVRRLRGAGAQHLLVAGLATDAKLILRTLQAGADLFLDQEELGSELESALARLQVRQPDGDRAGQLLAVLSAAGGCGASTIAVNLAALLAKEYGQCNLIDLNLGKADLAPLLDLKPQYTLADLCRNDERLDRSMYEKLLVRHPDGISLLAGPLEFEDTAAITTRGVARAAGVAHETFKDVVVDLQDCFQDEQAAVLERATRILLVCRLDFTALRNTRRIVDFLVGRGVPRERIEIVVNHFGAPDELPVAEAEAAVGGPLVHFVPYDSETICAANNTGVPAALTVPLADVVQSIARLVGLDAPVPAGPDRFTRLVAKVREEATARLQGLAPRARAVSLWAAALANRTWAAVVRLTRYNHAPFPPIDVEEVETCHAPILPQEFRATDPRAISA
ncbi:AAA family ATPase [Fimbriiglobus ruber]|uniref:Type II/IV secretion system ATPase TadZ/CpaE, associated with Flp pilus assembly n=1 Tax=Fimbriiglobus ruber TaxID=1908690 RepID=A0A225E798_9BACT|nr:hypothetical protein [Fimbriiglobus ruber]OWK44535.1 Type II/IV secretion system ATPase TadZ/CpaE, associated with Flp pilus assembly [Fimbriiglobus ruber]